MKRLVAGVGLVLALTSCSGSVDVKSSAPNTGSTTTSSSSTSTSTIPPTTTTPATVASSPPSTASSRSAVRPARPAPARIPPAAPAAGATAKATWYQDGSGTANGERFNADGLTFAHRKMAFGTVVRFCHAGRCVDARCNDRGPFVDGVTFDLSRGAFRSIAPLGSGVIAVTWAAV